MTHQKKVLFFKDL